jgi:hypothetical protein
MCLQGAIIAQVSDSVSYHVQCKIQLPDGKIVPGMSYTAEVLLYRDTDDLIHSIDWTFKNISLSDSIRSFEYLLVKALEDVTISVDLHAYGAIPSIRNVQQLGQNVKQFDWEGSGHRGSRYICDDYNLTKSSETFVTNIILDHLLVIYPVLFDLSELQFIDVVTTCPGTHVRYSLTPFAFPDQNNFGTAEYACLSESKTLIAYFNCSKALESECYEYLKLRAVARAREDYRALPKNTQRRVSETDFVQASEDHENKQLEHMLKTISERHRLNTQSGEARSLTILAQYDGTQFPVSIQVEREYLETRFYMPQDWNRPFWLYEASLIK